MRLPRALEEIFPTLSGPLNLLSSYSSYKFCLLIMQISSHTANLILFAWSKRLFIKIFEEMYTLRDT
jgi:hypothetical protein